MGSSGGRLEEDNLLAPIPHVDPDLTTKQWNLAFLRPMDFRLRLVTSTCAGGYMMTMLRFVVNMEEKEGRMVP